MYRTPTPAPRLLDVAEPAHCLVVDDEPHMRPYRPGVPLQATIAEPRRCSGAQFASDVVAAFLSAPASGAIDRSAIGERGTGGARASIGAR